MAQTLTSYSVKRKGITERVINNLLQIEGIYIDGSDVELYVLEDSDRGATVKVTVVGLETNIPTDIELREFTSLGLHKLDGDTRPTCYYVSIGMSVQSNIQGSNIFK